MPKNSHLSKLHVIVALLAALVLFAAACGSDDDDSTDAAATEEATEEPTDAPTEEPTEEATEEATEEPTEEATEEATPEPTPTEVELTDSFRGVTSEVIKVGVPVVDSEAIGQNPSHDAVTIWQAAADTINVEGGVLGRQIELHTSLTDPTDTISEDQACIELVEDIGVFAALGVFNNESVLCYIDIGEIIAVNTLSSSPEHFEKARAPYIGFPPLPDRAAEAQARVLIDAGVLEGKTVGLSAPRGEDGLAAGNGWKDALEAAGIEVTGIAQWTQPSSDQPAIDAEFDVIIESWRSDGVDAVVAVGTAGVPTTGALSRNGFDVLYTVTHPAATDVGLMEGFGYNVDSLIGAYAVVPPSEADLYEADVAGVKECVDNFDAAYDDDAPVEVRPAEEDTDVIGIIVRSCQALELFKMVAELAGPELTQDSFNAGADQLGETTDVTGILVGSLSTGKRDFADAAGALHEYDEELRRFVLS